MKKISIFSFVFFILAPKTYASTTWLQMLSWGVDGVISAVQGPQWEETVFQYSDNSTDLGRLRTNHLNADTDWVTQKLWPLVSNPEHYYHEADQNNPLSLSRNDFLTDFRAKAELAINELQNSAEKNYSTYKVEVPLNLTSKESFTFIPLAFAIGFRKTEDGLFFATLEIDSMMFSLYQAIGQEFLIANLHEDAFHLNKSAEILIANLDKLLEKAGEEHGFIALEKTLKDQANEVLKSGREEYQILERVLKFTTGAEVMVTIHAPVRKKGILNQPYAKDPTLTIQARYLVNENDELIVPSLGQMKKIRSIFYKE